MPSIFDISRASLSEPDVSSSQFVQQGVTDTYTADTIKLLGRSARNIVSGIAKSQLEGPDDNVDVVDSADPKYKDLTAKKLVNELNLSTITAARKQGKLTGDAAAVLVQSRAKEIINRYPFLTEEIKANVKEFFQGIGVTSGKGLFKDEQTLMEKVKEASYLSAAKSGQVNPHQSQDDYARSVDAWTDLKSLDLRRKVRMTAVNLSEKEHDIQAKREMNKYFNLKSILVESDLKNLFEQLEGIEGPERERQLEQLREDLRNEAFNSLDVTRIGLENLNARFDAVIGDRIDREVDFASGKVNREYYENQASSYEAAAKAELLADPSFAKFYVEMTILKGIPGELISGLDRIEISNMMLDMQRYVREFTKRRDEGTLNPKDVSDMPSVSFSTAEGAEAAYGGLLEAIKAVNESKVDPKKKSEIIQEVNSFLGAHAKGVMKNADEFDPKMWDTLLDTLSTRDSYQYFKEHRNELDNFAINGMKEILRSEFFNELIGEARTKAMEELSSRLRTKIGGRVRSPSERSTVRLEDYVAPVVINGELSWISHPDKDTSDLPLNTKGFIVEAINKLNKSYASRINRYVKVASHLSGNDNYEATMELALKGSGLVLYGEEVDDNKE